MSYGVIQAFPQRVVQYVTTINTLFPGREYVNFSAMKHTTEVEGTAGMILLDLEGLDDQDIYNLRTRGIEIVYNISEEDAASLVERVRRTIADHVKELDYGDMVTIDKTGDPYDRLVGRAVAVVGSKALVEIRLIS